jgi:hypothetical protein
MTTDGLRAPTPRTAERGTAGNRLAAQGRPTTTVPVIPLWERPGRGGHR